MIVLTIGFWLLVQCCPTLSTLSLAERRRRWLALPIGTFFHLVFDGAFNNTTVFWWPFAGFSFSDAPLPSLDRMPLNILLEVAGLAMVMWLWRVNKLSQPAQRERFLRTGQLLGGTQIDAGSC